MDLDPRSRDLLIRTVLGEAANEPDEGMAAVASVIRNRALSGRFGNSVPEVVLARNQFEPWNTQAGRNRMLGYAPDSPAYQRASSAVDLAFSGEDPTGGATHFYSPSAQAALGRQPPRWAQGEGQAIGRHTFYAPEGRVQMASNNAAGLPAGFVLDQQAPQQQAGGLPDGFVIDQQQSPVEQRFGGMQPPQNAQPLQAGLERQAAQMTTGQEQPAVAQMATEQRNLLSGAQQGTVPHADQYKGKLVSNETFESDSGDVMYKDPATGQVVPTDKSKQVALRDPKDGVIKVYDRSQDTNESGVVGAARVLAPGYAAGAATARPAIPLAPALKASDIAQTAKAPYREFSNIASKIEVPEQTAADFGGRLRGALDKINLDVDMAGKPASAAIRMLESPTEPLTLDYLQRVKRFAGRGFGSSEKDVRDGAAAISREIGKIIQEVSPEASAALKEGDAIHSTSLALQDLQRKSAVADLRAGRTGYGGNAVNTMRQEIGKIVQRAEEGKSTLLKPDELAAAREISQGTTATNALRQIGAMSPSKGGHAIIGGMLTGGISTALGAASNKLATILTGSQIDRLKELVAKRSPAYAEAVAKATDKWDRAHMELVNDPSPNKFAAYLSASRALSSGLQRDGVQISAGDLLRQLQGPMKSAADDENPKPEGVVNQ